MKYIQRIIQFVIMLCAIVDASEGRDSHFERNYGSMSQPTLSFDNSFFNRNSSESTPFFSNDDTSSSQCMTKKIACAGTTIGVCAAIPLFFGVVAPFLAGFSYKSEQVAFASFIWNAVSAASSLTDCSKNGCSAVIMMVATVCAVLYWGKWLDPYVDASNSGLAITNSSLNNGLWIANTTLTSIAPALTLFMIVAGGSAVGIISKLLPRDKG